MDKLRGYKKRLEHEWMMWRHRSISRRSKRQVNRWIERLRSSPPDVLIGANIDKSAGIRNHLLAIQRYSNLRVELAPSDELMRHTPANYFQSEQNKEFWDYSAQRIPVVHSHVYPWFIEWCRLKQENGKRWVHTYHLPYFPEHNRGCLTDWQLEFNDVLTNVASQADVCISITRWQQKFLLEKFGIKTIYIPNGVDVSFCKAANGNRFKKQMDKRPFVLYAGRNDPVKNPAEFVRLASSMNSLNFAMFGDGLDELTLRKSWDVKVPNNLSLFGQVSRGKLLDAIAACSAVVVTSWREGLPTLVLEAMALGKPVVVPNDLGCMEAIAGGTCGFVYRQGELDDLIDQTEMALADRCRAELGRKRILEEYDWAIVAPKLDMVYQNSGESKCA